MLFYYIFSLTPVYTWLAILWLCPPSPHPPKKKKKSIENSQDLIIINIIKILCAKFVKIERQRFYVSFFLSECLKAPMILSFLPTYSNYSWQVTPTTCGWEEKKSSHVDMFQQARRQIFTHTRAHHFSFFPHGGFNFYNEMPFPFLMLNVVTEFFGLFIKLKKRNFSLKIMYHSK